MKLPFIALLSVIALTAAPAFAAPVFADRLRPTEGGVFQEGNFVRLSDAAAWEAQGSTLENLAVVRGVGDGALRLAEGAEEGIYISPEIQVPAFEYLVASWSADTPADAFVEIQARAYVDKRSDTNGGWTGWLSWGKWGTGIRRASESTQDKNGLAYIDTDTLIICGDLGETSSKIQIRAILHRGKGGRLSPTLRQICATMKNTLKGQEIPVYHPDKGSLPDKVLLSTPSYSQMIREPSISNVICSPTAMTMLLNHRDPKLDLFPEEVAARCYDFDYEGYGNWSFTVAAAGSYGFDGYCHYADFEFLRQELAQGRSVEISVYYSSHKGGSNPYLENGAISNTDGHLITIVGYEKIDGADYFISNDSAAPGDVSSARRLYRADQLDACWKGRLAYAVSPEKEWDAGGNSPLRIPAHLEHAGGDAYRLISGGEYTPLSGFTKGKASPEKGCIILITNKDGTAEMPEGVEITAANRKLRYINVDGDGNLIIGSDLIKKLRASSGTAYVIVNNGTTYEAAVTFPEGPSGRTGHIAAIALLLAGGAAACALYAKAKKAK